MCDVDPPVPFGPGIGLRVHLGEHHRGVDVAGLIGDSQIKGEIGPVVRERVDYLLEVLGEGHGEAYGFAPMKRVVLGFASKHPRI